jgi:hypothetical protein
MLLHSYCSRFIFWDTVPCQLVNSYHIPKDCSASIFTVNTVQSTLHKMMDLWKCYLLLWKTWILLRAHRLTNETFQYSTWSAWANSEQNHTRSQLLPSLPLQFIIRSYAGTQCYYVCSWKDVYDKQSGLLNTILRRWKIRPMVGGDVSYSLPTVLGSIRPTLIQPNVLAASDCYHY